MEKFSDTEWMVTVEALDENSSHCVPCVGVSALWISCSRIFIVSLPYYSRCALGIRFVFPIH
ncbi:hypothetical protein T4D_235 [Trichinella pseudospiralis]|uniref:Uncharacterized protein n=1 Tax=Trichinella pseudospiralis TaxID=6337 RepID=A0A0V1G0D8_TRIPS|nr:hypothetical protein T4D_235 [Trichinella pseudospiralis]